MEKAGGYLRIGVTSQKDLAVDQMAIRLNTDVVPVHAFQKILTIWSNILHLAQIARIKDAEADFSKLVRVPHPALGVKTDDDHVVC